MNAIKILGQLKEKGIRFTPQRQAILEYLLATDTHPTAEEVYSHVKKIFPGVSLGTIYNTLNMLKENGFVLELSYGDMSSRFDGNPHNHYHIACTECGRVFDFHRPLLAIEDEVANQSGFLITGHRLEFYGICSNCAE